jgi:hypothetical protein
LQLGGVLLPANEKHGQRLQHTFSKIFGVVVSKTIFK